MNTNFSISLLTHKFGSIIREVKNEIKFICPKCKVKAFWINTSTGIFNCFSCNYSGTLASKEDKEIGLPNFKEVIDTSEVLNHIKKTSGTDIRNKMDGQFIYFRDINLLDYYKFVCKVRYFFRDRRIKLDYKLHYLIGNFLVKSCSYYLPTVSETIAYLSKKNYIIFPCKENKRFVYWQGRCLDDKGIKNLNCPVGVGKENIVYNINILKNEKRKYFLLVEGIIDALACNGIASLGNVLSINQALKIDYFLRGRNAIVFVCYDNDAYNKSIEACKMVLSLNLETMFFPIEIKQYKDYDEYRRYGIDFIPEIIEQSIEEETFNKQIDFNGYNLKKELYEYTYKKINYFDKPR